MALIKSISGIRGTIGGIQGENLTPFDVLKFTLAYSKKVKQKFDNPKIVVGRDARISGFAVKNLVIGSLLSAGIDVIDIDFATTPTTEIAVINEKAQGGIIITASHNPKNWNALKLLNEKGEFLNEAEAKEVLNFSEQIEEFVFPTVENFGHNFLKKNYEDIHIQKILDLDILALDKIKQRKFKIVVDCINSVGSIAVPKLLKSLGADQVIEINCDLTGEFAHNPEPLEKNLNQIIQTVKNENADVGFVIDPDVDRLAIIADGGVYFGEENTLIAIADYILQKQTGNTVSNLSSSMGLKDITEKHGGKYFYSAVGEINVVEKMKEVNAIIGGEGNGGVIYPPLHYGRDALVGIALFLSYLAEFDLKASDLLRKLPKYFMVKTKVENKGFDKDKFLEKAKEFFAGFEIITLDGVKLATDDAWVLIRQSNTEPILRIYSEAKTLEKAEQLIEKVKNILK